MVPSARGPLELREDTRNSAGCSTANAFTTENDVRLGLDCARRFFRRAYLGLKTSSSCKARVRSVNTVTLCQTVT
jgi:hypothetical protein